MSNKFSIFSSAGSQSRATSGQTKKQKQQAAVGKAAAAASNRKQLSHLANSATSRQASNEQERVALDAWIETKVVSYESSLCLSL